MKINQSLFDRVSASPETKGLSMAQIEEALRSFQQDVTLLRDGLQRAPYLIAGVSEVGVSFCVDLDDKGVKSVFKVAAAILGGRLDTRWYLCVLVVDFVIRFQWPGKDKPELAYDFLYDTFELDGDVEDTTWDLYGEGSKVTPCEVVVSED